VFKRWFLSQARDRTSDLVAARGIKVVTFTDYQCPACASTVIQDEAVIDAFRRTRPVPIEVVYRDFPLESECNATMQNQMHPVACEAAVAVRLVTARFGGATGHEFGVSLYRNRTLLSPEYVQTRLDEYDLGAEYTQRYAATLKDVAADVALGARLGVRSTPTSFINGTKLPSTSVRNFEMALQYEAERLSGGAGSGRGSSVVVQ
jgi:protein-disulfide isomerase